MSTILPTDGQRQITNVTSFVIGQVVQSNVDGRLGTIVAPQGQLPLPTPASPSTSNVNVNWADGTSSVVNVSTLEQV